MKIILKNIVFTPVVLLVVALVSCDDKLNQLPPNTLIVENAITNEATAETAVNGIYSYFGDYGELVGLSITTQALRSNLVEVSTQRSSYEFELAALEIADDWVYTKELWVDIFKVINAANNVIYQLEGFSDSDFSPGKRVQMLGEAHFMRGYALLFEMKTFSYFWDINSEYGPLIRVNPAGLNNNVKSRSSVAEGYEQVLTDLRYASEHGPEFYAIYRSSNSLAKAYIVETLLMRGDEGDLQQAAQIADEVINTSGFVLEPTFEQVYSTGYESTELMFSRHISEENIGVSDLSSNVASVYSLLGKKRNGPNDNYFSYLDNEDTRYPFIIGDAIDANGVSYTGTWLKHFDISGDVPMRFMRLTQMYLYKAEALARSGAPVANVLEPLNILRERAGMPLFDANDISAEDLMQIIFNELVIEIGVENGAEYFAAIRMYDSGGERIIKSLNPAFLSENQLVLPIPADELLFNPQMTPNPL